MKGVGGWVGAWWHSGGVWPCMGCRGGMAQAGG